MAAPKGISRQLGPKDSLGRCPHGTTLAMLKTRCPSCLITELEAQVARLEAAIRAKDAALRELADKAECAMEGEYPLDADRVAHMARAALSDAGEGWPEVREQYLELIRRAERIIGMELEPAPPCEQPHGKLGGAALEVVDWLTSARTALNKPRRE